MADTSANLRVRISADVNDIKQGLALLRGQLADLRKQASTPLASNDPIKQLGISAGQTANAMRQLPAQFTDVFTSLQGGMPWFTVLVQQGGQIKDSFGGIGPALSGVSAAIVGMVNPLTVTAAAAAALALAWKQGSDEGTTLRQTMIGVGDSSGQAAKRLQELAAQMDDLDGVTVGSATEALNEVAASGKFTAEQIELVGTAAEVMRVSTGKAVAQTVAEFEKIKADPVEALLALNETMHFLDQTQLENIKTLVEQGNQVQAVAGAFRLYADTLKERSKDVTENLGYMERAWRAVRDATLEAWDAMKSIGRDETATDKIKQLQSNIAGIKQGGGVYQGLSAANRTMLIARFEQQIAELQKQANKKPVEVKFAGIYSEVDSAQARAREKFETQYLDKQGRLAERIKEMRKLAGEAGITDPKVLDARERAIRAEAAPKGHGEETAKRSAGLQALKDAWTKEDAQIATSTKVLQAQFQAREVTAEDYYGRMRELTERATDEEAASLQKQIDYLRSRSASGKEGVEVSKQIGELEAQLAKVRTEGAAKLEVLGAEERKFFEERKRAISSYKAALDASTVALKDQMDAMVARVGAGDREYEIQQKLNDVYREQAQRLTELALLKSAGKIDPETAEAEASAVRASTDQRVQVIRDGYDRMAAAQSDWSKGVSAAWANYRDSASNAAGMVESAATSAFSSLEEAAIKATQTGKLSVRDMTNSILADFARIAMRKGITALLGGLFGGGQASAGVERESIPLQGWDGGGYTGPGGRLQVAGWVHKGEGVLNQDDIAAIGGPSSFLAMLRTIRRGRGYANGGLVGMSAPVAPLSGLGGMKLEINVQNQTGGQVSAQQVGAKVDGNRMIVDMVLGAVAGNIADGGQVASAMKGRFGLKEPR
ncbi:MULTISPECIES: phage tail length tape measure family protein [unclassified Xanthomonas]|uniref:phage tail length tape measure family protein n=1 Tax=unclassified Xanthomonas TaxID=2643310 RepID=UPI002A81C252|nr:MULTISPECIES: phage tail length tape measure family protein [unclassified Xanthomonas]MDY4296835.1 phage tail length tape measure family protein [Xanthomonas sp. LF02-5]MDY4358406.1 phage tail length tape measure family protein [Xanthomonas sp. LF04-12]